MASAVLMRALPSGGAEEQEVLWCDRSSPQSSWVSHTGRNAWPVIGWFAFILIISLNAPVQNEMYLCSDQQ